MYEMYEMDYAEVNNIDAAVDRRRIGDRLHKRYDRGDDVDDADVDTEDEDIFLHRDCHVHPSVEMVQFY